MGTPYVVRAGLLAAAVAVLTGCYSVPGPATPRIHGIRVEAQGDGGPVMAGELLAASGDSLWLLVDTDVGSDVHAMGLRGAVVRPVEGGRLRPHMTAFVAGGAIVLIAAAGCREWCLGLGLGAAGGLQFVGLLARAASAVPALPLATDPDHLRRFARFPAGLPPGFPRR